MTPLFKNAITRGLITVMSLMLLFGCATVKEMEVSQKYEDSKSWFKEKWQAMGTKLSTSDDVAPGLEPYPENSKYLVYHTQWSYETLPGIAEWFTGDTENWKTLAVANPKLKPKHIAAGAEVLIPARLVKKKTLPTEAFAAKHRVYYYVHVVKWRGESLSLIAKWYTGSYGNWKALARANPGLNPNLIAIDNRINIPPEMMKTKKPLPRKVVAKTLPGYFAHTVINTDEKLSDIARWYTGSTSNLKVLAAENPDIDPDFLLVGNEIYVPADLLKTKKPLGEKTARKTARASEKSSTNKADTTAPETNKIRLFGPKQFQAN